MRRRSFLRALLGFVGVAAAAPVGSMPAVLLQASRNPYPYYELAAISGRGIHAIMRRKWDEHWWDLIEIRRDGTEDLWGGVSEEHLVEIGQTPEQYLRMFVSSHGAPRFMARFVEPR